MNIDPTVASLADDLGIQEEQIRRWLLGVDAVPPEVHEQACRQLIEKRLKELQGLRLDQLLEVLGDEPVPPAVQVVVEEKGTGEQASFVRQASLREFCAQLLPVIAVAPAVKEWVIEMAIAHEGSRLSFMSLPNLVKYTER